MSEHLSIIKILQTNMPLESDRFIQSVKEIEM